MSKQLRTNGWALWCLAIGLVLAGPQMAAVHAAPAHPRPFLMPPAEKAPLLERAGSKELARKQYETIKARADQGSPGDAALMYALEGGQRYADTVRRNLLEKVRYRAPRLDEDVGPPRLSSSFADICPRNEACVASFG